MVHMRVENTKYVHVVVTFLHVQSISYILAEDTLSREQRHVYININSDDDNYSEGGTSEGGEPSQTPPPTGGSGVVYTRWGKSTCPDVEGTELVYAGRAGGSRYNVEGGASNYICLPDNPQYLDYQDGVQGYSLIYGTESESEEQPLSSVFQQNVACAVYYASNRSVHLMIPARYECPTAWTREYYGYLMSGATLYYSGYHRTMFECVDNDPDAVPGESANPNTAQMHHVEAVCFGLDCPPYMIL